MKLQKPQNSTPKLKGVIGSARMRPKLNNYTFVDEDIMIYKKNQTESSHQQSQEEHYSALRRLHAQGMTQLKSYKIEEALNSFKIYMQRMAHELGRDHAYFLKAFPALIQQLCQFALRTKDEAVDIDVALMILNWAEELTLPVHQFEVLPINRCLVYNNLGCLYRRAGKLQLALNLLEKALEIVQTHDIPSKSITYLNITAVLSQMGYHDKALEYAHISLRECQQELTLFLRAPENAEQDQQFSEMRKYVGIALHNIAVEEESCGQLQQASQSYQRTLAYMNTNFGANDPLTMKFFGQWSKSKSNLGGGGKTLLKRQTQKPLSQTIQGVHRSRLLTPQKSQSFYYRGESSATDQNKIKSMALLQLQNTSNSGYKSDFKSPEINPKAEINDLQLIGVLDWTDSEGEDHKVVIPEVVVVQTADPIQNISPNASINPQILHEQQRDFRINFLQKMKDENQIIQQTNFQKQQEQLKAHQYKESVLKVQKWTRAHIKKHAKSPIIPPKQHLRQPIKENAAALMIQKNIKRYLSAHKKQKLVKKDLILMSCLFEPTLVDEEMKIVYNQVETQFWFRLSITKPHKIIKVCVSPHSKNKLDKKNQRGVLKLEIPVDSFFTVIVSLQQYIDFLESSVDEDVLLTEVFVQLRLMSQPYVKQIRNSQDLIDYQLLNNQESITEEYLRRINPLLQGLVRVQQNNTLILLGFNDFSYDLLTKQIIPQKQQKKRLIALSWKGLQSVIRIQTKVRVFLQKMRATSSKVRHQQILNKFIVKNTMSNVKEYFRVYVVSNMKTDIVSIYCRIESTKKLTNLIPLNEIITKSMGYPGPMNFLEIYQVDIGASKLEYTEEGMYWMNKDNGIIKVEKVNLGMINRAANMIQGAARRHLIKQTLKIRLLNSRRIALQQKEYTRQCLSKKYIIQGDLGNRKGYYMNFVLQTKRDIDESNNHMSADRKKFMAFLTNEGPQKETKQQQIIIQVRSLGMGKQEYVQPYQQKLFNTIKQTEMEAIAHKMLHIAYVDRSTQSGELFLNVKHIEEVQGLILNEKKQQNKMSQKDDTLEARRIFNIQSLRNKFLFQNNSLIEYTKKGANSEVKILCTQKNKTNHQKIINNFFKKVVRGFSSYKTKNIKNLYIETIVTPYDHANISDYVRGYKCSSEYGFGVSDPIQGAKNMNFLQELLIEESRVKQSKHDRMIEEERAQNEKFLANQEIMRANERNLQLIFVDYCVVSSQRVFLKIVFNILLDRLQLTASASNEDVGGIKLEIEKKNLAETVNEAFMRTHVDQMIIRQLQIQDDELKFVVDSFTQSKIQTEQLKWEQYQLYKKVLVSANQGHPMDIALLLSLSSNQNQKTSEALSEFNLQIIIMEVFDREQLYESEYVYNFTSNQIILTVYLKSNLKIRHMYVIPIATFQCNHLNKSLKEKTPEDMKKLLHSTIHAIETILLVWQALDERGNKLLCTNFDEFSCYLTTIFQEQFLRKIQNFIKVRLMTSTVAIKRSNIQQVVFLSKLITNIEGRYIEIRFYLLKRDYTIKFYIDELSAIDEPRSDVPTILNKLVYKIDLLQLSDRSVFTVLEQSLNETQRMQFKRINPEWWLELQSHHAPDYYRRLFSPLTSLVTFGAKISYPKGKIKITFEGLKVPIQLVSNLVQETESQKMKTQPLLQQPHIFDALLRLQSATRRAKMRLMFVLATERKVRLESKTRQVGVLVKRAIRRIDAKLYIVNVYKRQDGKYGQQDLTFDLIPYTNAPRNKLKKLRGFLLWNATMMLNLGSRSLHDYLIDQIYVESGEVKFKESDFHHMQELGVQPFVGRGTVRVSTAIVEEDPTKMSFLDKLSGPNKLVHHHQGSNVESEIPQTIYNVIYTGRSTLRARQQDLQENTVQVEVNLDNVRKLYPTLNTFDDDVMKVIGQQLIDGLRINKNGELLVDQATINPNLITIRENTLLAVQDASALQEHTPTKPSYTKILLKKTTYYQNTKYLVVINYIERKITKILTQRVDQVFEEYEVLFQVMASNMTNKEQKPLIWNLSPEEAIVLSHQTEKSDIAHTMVKRVLILEDKFIYLCEYKSDKQRLKNHYPNVILLLEKGIRPIQQRVKNREYVRNFKKYREMVARWKDHKGRFIKQVALYSLEALKSTTQFIVLCGEDDSKHIMLYAWDVVLYQAYFIELPKQKYTKLLMDSKNDAIRAMCGFVVYNPDENALMFLAPTMDTIKHVFLAIKQQSMLQDT